MTQGLARAREELEKGVEVQEEDQGFVEEENEGEAADEDEEVVMRRHTHRPE